jgi:multidrug efflux system membrane fusion protein
MKWKPIAIVLVGLAIVAAAVVYWPGGQTTTQKQGMGMGGKGKRFAGPASDEPVPVLAIDARRADVPVYLDGVGTARALNTVLVKPQVEGKLIAISFTEGQEVPQGFVLAKIDPATYQAQYDQAVATKAFRQAQLTNAQLDLERYERLAKTNAVNKQQVDTQKALVAQLEAQVRGDQAAIDNTRAILSYTDITAPIAGRTGIRQVDVGNIVRPADATGIVLITQIRPITVLFNLPQQNLLELNKGLAEGALPVEAMGPDGRTAVDSGKVSVIDNQIDPTTGTVRLKAEFPNVNMQLWPGQFVNVRLLIDTLRQVVVVPTAAVQRGPTGTFVFIVGEESKVSIRPVAVAQQDDTRAVIAKGLEAGERVVTTGFARLAAGTVVEAANAEEAGQLPTPSLGPQPRGKRGKGMGMGMGGVGGTEAEKGEKGEKGKESGTQGAGAKAGASP